MLTISKPLSARQALTYHAEQFANGADNYYTADPVIAGQWDGQLAQAFGLTGAVDAAHFRRLAEGHHPITDAPLLQARIATPYVTARGVPVSPMAHRAGWDATFSAPKSVSLVALVGGDDRVRLAHRVAVATALRALEPYTQARRGGNTPPETTGQWVAATFDHDSARPVQGYAAPQLHTHVVIFNMTAAGDGRIRAIQPRELYTSQQFATAVYRADLARQLRALGYDVERGANQQPEIRGFTPAYLAASSPRRQQILTHLQAAQRSGAGPAQIAAHRTREAKIQYAHVEMQRRHQELAAAFGEQPARAVAVAQARGHQVQPDPPDVAAAAVTFAKHRNLERAAVVDERALLRDALQRSLGEVSVARVHTEFNDRVRSGEFLSRRQTAGAAGRAFTTPEMVALEQATLQAMRSGQGQHRALVTAQTRADIHRDYAHLNAGQRVAVQQILASRDTVTALEGVAGGGKTTALAAVRTAAERDGYRVAGLAPTSRAAQVLADTGMATQTLQRHLTQAPHPTGDGKTLYVLDESSLASTVQLHAFLTRLQPDDRVLLVGDVRQHQSVDAGRAYAQLQDAGLQTARLDTIVRQPDPAYQTIVEQLARGEVRPALRQLDAQQRVHEMPNRADRIQAIATAYSAHPTGTLVVAPDNHSRIELNDAIHRRLTAQGQVHERTRQTTVLVPRQDLTGADRTQAHRYQEGDVLRYAQGSAARGLAAGDYARVVHVDAAANQLTVRRRTGATVTYDPQRLQGVSVYREADRSFAVGDRLQFTAPFRDQHVANRELGTITALTASTMRVTLDSGRQAAFQLKDYAHLDYGYAVTSYSSQGQTADRVLVHIDTDRAGEALVNQRLAYVALSRGRYDAQIYTNDKAQLAHALSRDVSHRSAIEPKQQRQGQGQGQGMAL